MRRVIYYFIFGQTKNEFKYLLNMMFLDTVITCKNDILKHKTKCIFFYGNTSCVTNYTFCYIVINNIHNTNRY